MNAWLNADVRSIILSWVAATSKRTCGLLIRCGFVSMRDVRRALFVSPPHVHAIISAVLMESVKGPNGSRLMRQIDMGYQFCQDQRVTLLEGRPVTLWVLPSLVESMSTDELAVAMAGAVAHANYTSIWFIFRRIAQTEEHEELAVRFLLDWIWTYGTRAESLVHEFPLRRNTLLLMLNDIALSEMLHKHMRMHPRFDALCWDLLVDAIVLNDTATVACLLKIGVQLHDAPNLIDLALAHENITVCLLLLGDDAASAKYANGDMLRKLRTSLGMTFAIARVIANSCRQEIVRIVRKRIEK